MTSPQVDGAYPRRAAAANSATGTGPKPKVGSSDRARAEQLAANFSAQMELSMMQSLTQLSAGGAGNSGDGGEGGEESGSASISIDSGTQQMLLMTSIMTGMAKNGNPAANAQLQAQMSALGLGNMGGTTAGAGSEAKLAQQLLAALGGADAASAGANSASGTGATSATFTGSVDSGAAANAQVVAQVARERGVDPTLAVAMMLVESGGRSKAVGDGGTSFGLFQLHEGGMLTAAGLTSSQAFDPRTNASVALKSLRHEWDKGHARRSPGEIAAASQRPADPVGYAAKVDGAMARARSLLAGS